MFTALLQGVRLEALDALVSTFHAFLYAPPWYALSSSNHQASGGTAAENRV